VRKVSRFNGLPVRQLTVTKALAEEIIRSTERPATVANLLDFEQAEVAALVYDAANLFLPADMDAGIHTIENRWEKSLDGFQHYGTSDIELGAIPELRGCDWKTTKSADADWESNMRRSWQWRIYAWARGYTHFQYRGIERLPSSWLRDSSGNVVSLSNHKTRIRVFTIEIPPDNAERVERYLRGLNGSRAALAPLEIWPQNSKSCNAFGRPCPYYGDCWGRGNMKPSPLWTPPLNNSGADLFLMCPERYRRSIVDGGSDEGNEATIFGTEVHAWLAAIWTAAKSL
jgi:hypothetical protein